MIVHGILCGWRTLILKVHTLSSYRSIVGKLLANRTEDVLGSRPRILMSIERLLIFFQALRRLSTTSHVPGSLRKQGSMNLKEGFINCYESWRV